MATNILMPALSPTMTEGTLARWLKHEGDTVKAGEIIAEIETDKATMEVEAVDEGVLGRILVADGTQGVKVNDPIAILVDPGEKVPDGAAPARAPAPAPTSAPTPTPTPPPATVSVAPAAAAAPVAPMPTPIPAPAAAAPVANGHDASRVFASPLARRMARQAGLDLAAVQGSGPNGRIVRADIDAALAKPAAATATPTPSAPKAAPVLVAPAGLPPHKLVPHSTIRRVIARRLTEAKATIPHFYVSMDVELDALLALRAQLNRKSPADGPAAFKLSVNDLIIKAAAVALRQVPGVNASWTDEGIALYDDVDISVAVSIPEGLITPIVRQADRKGLAAISNEMKDLAARAKTGKLKPEEFQGGGFSISNMGMYGVTTFAAIINPPQAGILAVSAGEKRAVVRGDKTGDGTTGGDKIEIATVMTCTLSVDHRVIDGALGARWLGAFRRIVEEPLSLML